MRRTKEDAEKTRQDILASARDIFYEKGYSKTTFDEIAKRINLTKGAVYWYFRNKPDIVAALINEYAENHLGALTSYVSADKCDFEQLIDMAIFNNHILKTDTTTYKFLFFITCQMEWSEAIINKIYPSIEQTKQVTRGLFIKVLDKLKANKKIRSDVDILLISEILMATYSGLLEAYFTKRLTNDFDNAVKTGFQLIYNSIKTEGIDNED
ncbi:MAG: TetR/AcrR family transcriptional regulator [Alphaproteobacteria bacterium]|nr:TetR/AcrR family transcriptional regulator [Alphaproteobacteria bacterium]